MIDIVKFDDLFLKSKKIYHDPKEEWWEVHHKNNNLNPQPYVLRILTDQTFQDDFTKLYQLEHRYFDNKQFEVSPLSRDGDQLGYYRPKIGEIVTTDKTEWNDESYQPLTKFFNVHESLFVKRGRLTPEGQELVITIWREAKTLENLNLKHTQRTLSNIFIKKIKHVGYSVIFQHFALDQHQPLLPLLDQTILELIGTPYEKFLAYLKSQSQ